MKDKRLNWIIPSVIYLIFVLLDGLLTYINTPDLKREANPLVSHLGLGWGALFTANLIGAVLYVMAARYCTNYKTGFLPAKNFKEYRLLLFYGRSDKPLWPLYKYPTNRKASRACICYAVIYALLVARIVVVMEWTAVTLKINMSLYYRMRGMLPLRRLDVWMSVLAGISLYYYWVYREFKRSQRREV